MNSARQHGGPATGLPCSELQCAPHGMPLRCRQADSCSAGQCGAATTDPALVLMRGRDACFTCWIASRTSQLLLIKCSLRAGAASKPRTRPTCCSCAAQNACAS
eukprot:356712-Chlamydomonas_euryale.AAC.3